MSLQISINDLGNTTPIPLHYSIELDYSEDNLKETIEVVASSVSKIYARLPRLGSEERKQLQAWFAKSQELPPERECEQFESALKAKIIENLSQGSHVCHLSTADDRPVALLKEVACNVFKKKSRDLSSFFPLKTCTVISLNKNKSTLFLDMNFKNRYSQYLG